MARSVKKTPSSLSSFSFSLWGTTSLSLTSSPSPIFTDISKVFFIFLQYFEAMSKDFSTVQNNDSIFSLLNCVHYKCWGTIHCVLSLQQQCLPSDVLVPTEERHSWVHSRGGGPFSADRAGTGKGRRGGEGRGVVGGVGRERHTQNILGYTPM